MSLIDWESVEWVPGGSQNTGPGDSYQARLSLAPTSKGDSRSVQYIRKVTKIGRCGGSSHDPYTATCSVSGGGSFRDTSPSSVGMSVYS